MNEEKKAKRDWGGRTPLPDHQKRKRAVYYITDAERKRMDALYQQIVKEREQDQDTAR